MARRELKTWVYSDEETGETLDGAPPGGQKNLLAHPYDTWPNDQITYRVC